MGDGLASPEARSGPDERLVDGALALAETDPQQALAALDGLGPDAPPGLVGRAEWVRGRALRQLGRNQQASVHLEAAVRALGLAGEDELAAQASVSLALERIDEARFDEAIDLLDRAVANLSGDDSARALAQKALALQRADRSRDAVVAWDEAVSRFEAAGMATEAGVARQNRGLVRIYRGDLAGAEADLSQAEQTFRAAGLDIRALEAVHNLGLVYAHRGDLPRAFELFDAAQAEAGRLGTIRPQALVDRAQVALDAGLVPEGRTLAEMAVERLEAAGFQADVPEACLLAARAAEMDGDPPAAARWARRAVALLDEQGRGRWELLARVAARRAEAAGGEDTAAELHVLAEHLRDAGWIPPAMEADTEAAVLHVGRGRLDEAGPILAGLRRSVARASPPARLEIRLAQAHYATATGDLRTAKRAVTAAVGALRDHRATVGSVELRNRAGGRGDAVIDAGIAVALAAGDPRAALWTSEAVGSPTPAGHQEDPEVDGLLGDLRTVNARIASLDAGRGTAPPADLIRLRRRRAAIEELLRRRTRHRRPSRQTPWTRVDTDRIVAGFAGIPLIEYATHADRLYALVVAEGDVALADLANLADSRRVVAGLRLALHIAVTDGLGATDEAVLARAARAAQDILFTPLAIGRPERAVIVGDRGPASFPWALLPALTATELTATPSATWWLDRSAAVANPSPAPPRVVLIAGPGLRHAEAEVKEVAALWPGAEVITAADATVARVKEAIRQADIVHVAAHASHRGDHPLLSGIRLWDGHLTGYELSTLQVPARLMVLSCCETGMAETAGGIGLSRLVTEQSGVATAVASVSPLADSSAGPLMADFHRCLAGGASPARALVESRNAWGGPLRNPTAAGLVCFGV